MLSVCDISVGYGGVAALSDVSIQVNPGEIVGIIGANGAGKSTLLRAVMGLIPIDRGRIELFGEDITGEPTSEIVCRGMSMVTETRDIFPSMSCRDNLRTGLFLRSDRPLFDDAVGPVFKLFPRLEERLSQTAGSLSGGEQQMLAIARALLQRPRVLILDEPSLGLSPALTEELFHTLSLIRSQAEMLVLVEQKAKMVLDLVDRAYVLSIGKISHQGTADELRGDSHLRQAYFGEPRTDTSSNQSRGSQS